MNWPSLRANQFIVVAFIMYYSFLCLCLYISLSFHFIFIVASDLNAHNYTLSSFHTNWLPIYRLLIPLIVLSCLLHSWFTFILTCLQIVDLNLTFIWRNFGQLDVLAACLLASMVVCAVMRVFFNQNAWRDPRRWKRRQKQYILFLSKTEWEKKVYIVPLYLVWLCFLFGRWALQFIVYIHCCYCSYYSFKTWDFRWVKPILFFKISHWDLYIF